jgi:hypothetical protein
MIIIPRFVKQLLDVVWPADGQFLRRSGANIVGITPVASDVGAADATIMPRLENRHALRDFFKQLYAYSLEPTFICIGTYGDSVAGHVYGEFLQLLFQSLPRADLQGPSALQSSLNRTLSGATYDGQSVSILSQSNMDGAGGSRDFTYLPSGEHITLGNGGVLQWDSRQQTGFTSARVYLATGPGMGSAFCELLNEAGAVLSSQTIALSAGSLGATKATFVLTNTIKHKVRITATGVVVHLRTIFLAPAGIVPLQFNMGGSALAQNNYSNPAIFSYIATDLGLSLLFLQAKEEGLPGSMAPTMARFATLTNTSKLIVGSLPDSTSAETQIANNAQFRAAALANGHAYFDGYAAIGSYAELVRLGWITDGTHPLTPANRFVAGLIMAELNAPHLLSGNIRRTVDHGSSSLDYVASQSIRTYRGDNSGGTIEVLTNSGYGTPGSANLKNLRRILFGDPAGSTPGIMGYGTNGVMCIDQTENPIFLRAKYILTTDEFSVSTFAGDIKALRYRCPGTITPAGVTGNQTINKGAGTVNFAAGQQQIVVTNSLCGVTAGLPFATVRTGDSTAQIKNVIPFNGGFTINLVSPATAETSVGWFLILMA